MYKELKQKQIQTDRLEVSYLEAGEENKNNLILLHGNTSSNLFYIPTIDKLKDDFHIYSPDLRGYGYTEKLPIDSTKGVRVWSEDIRSFIKKLNIEKPIFVGWSMGGGVAMQYAIDYPSDISGIGLINPLSPYGYSGTKLETGESNNPDYSGTGAGGTNPKFVNDLKNKTLGTDSSTSAENVLKTLFAPDYKVEDDLKELFVKSMLLMEIGEDFYPGDFKPSTYWPFFGPGERGTGNCMSPKYVNLESFSTIEPKVPVIWFRGVKDSIVSDASFLDIGNLGKLNILPDWPGEKEYPPQPMVKQTRYVLEKYQENGGKYKEVVFENSGHAPQIEEESKFVRELKEFFK
ncbi:MAG: alpha/beta hydrolase [Clostridium sp.]|nr:alpha/beta hydrolase [Clostridium sp.]